MSAPRAARFCIRCGAARLPEARFCTTCGADLSLQVPAPPAAEPAGAADAPAVGYCPACGAEQPHGHAFCTRCGAALQAPPEPDPIPTPWVRADASSPVRLTVRRVPRHGRLGALLRLPPVLVALVVASLWFVVAIPAVAIAWFARVAGRPYPGSLRRFVSAFLELSTRGSCYASMLTPEFPRLGPGRLVDIGLPEPGDGRPWLRLPLVLSGYPVLLLEILVALMCAIVAWLTILFVGRLPEGMADVLEQPQRYSVRYWAYALLLSDTYPWFQPEREAPVSTPALT